MDIEKTTGGPLNEREQSTTDRFPVDRPGDRPENKAPRGEPTSRGDVPQEDPKPNEPAQRAPTDSDIARHGRIEATAEDQATVDAANGEKNVSVEGP